jgi:hypothetical protein
LALCNAVVRGHHLKINSGGFWGDGCFDVNSVISEINSDSDIVGLGLAELLSVKKEKVVYKMEG